MTLGVRLGSIRLMHAYPLALTAAFACALCNGGAAVLQKISADKEKNVAYLDATLMLRLLQNKPYVIGILLDILGWGFTLYAVRTLPLFLVESIVAVNIVFTAIFELIYKKRGFHMRGYLSIAVVLGGLVLLAVSSAPERATPASSLLKIILFISPFVIGIMAYFLTQRINYRAAVSLSALAGLAFGVTSIIGRIIDVPDPFWQVIFDPLLYALLLSGGLGTLFFAIALQKAQATTVNAAMSVSQTIIPALIGIAVLGDHARHGLWALVIVGTFLSLAGVLSLINSPRTTS